MLESLRSRRNSKWILFAFSAIILVFIFWGIGPTGDHGSGTNTVATVDGQDIGVKEYANLYKREVEYYRNTFKEQFNEEMIRKMNLKQRTLDILINRALAAGQAKAENIKVTDSEVQDAIRSIPAFSKDGVFDRDQYFRVLSSNRVKPAEFEKSVEQDLITSKMRDRVIKDIKVTDEEVKQAYAKENRKVDLNYVALDGSRFASGVEVTDKEAGEYLKKNGSAFMVPVKVKAFYAYANYNDLARKAKVTDEEIKEFYDKNSKQFETPEQVKARHILIRPDDRAADKEKARKDARAKAEDILKKIKGGAKFSELAKENSQDPGSARQGGDLGWFQKGVMVKPFEDAVFSLKKGETSGIVETEFGYHIILVEDRKEGGPMPMKAATEYIKRSVSQIKARTMAKDELTALEKPFREAKTIDELRKAAEAQKDLKTMSTDFFSEDDRRVELARNEALKESVFPMRAGEVSRIIDTPEGLYLIKVLERQEAHVPDFKDIASKVKARIASEKAGELASKKAEELLKRVKGGEDFAKVARDEKLKVEETGYFSRVEGFIPKIGAFAGDRDRIFDLTSASPVYQEVLPYNDKFYILKLKDVKEADEAGLEKKREEIKSRLLAERQDEALGKWLKDLRAKAKIKVYEERL